MTKNAKIALGCGGAGCFGLIVVAVAGVLIYFMWSKPRSRTYNFNVSNINRNSNSNSRSNVNSGSSSSPTASSMSEDDKHKLFQAASMTGDAEVLRRAQVKMGLMNEDFTPGDEYIKFMKDHIVWAYSNADFIQSLDSQEKALAYVNEHMP